MVLRMFCRIAATIALLLPAGPATAQSQQKGLGILLDSASTFVVRAVLPGSSAATAGIRTGDVLVRIDGLPASFAQLDKAMRTATAQHPIRMQLTRGSRALNALVVPADIDLNVAAQRVPLVRMRDVRSRAASYLQSACVGIDSAYRSGLRSPSAITDVECIPARLRNAGPDTLTGGFPGALSAATFVAGMRFFEYRAPAAAKGASPSGLLVLFVAPRSAAEQAGVKVGDLVIASGGSPVLALSDLRRLLTARNGSDLTVYRDGRELRISLPLR